MTSWSSWGHLVQMTTGVVNVTDGISDERSDVCPKEESLTEGGEVPWEASGEMTGEGTTSSLCPYLSASHKGLNADGSRSGFLRVAEGYWLPSSFWWGSGCELAEDRAVLLSLRCSSCLDLLHMKQKTAQSPGGDWGWVSISSLYQKVPPRWSPRDPPWRADLVLGRGGTV